MFEEKIVKASKEKIAKLYGAAMIAEKKPDTGITVNKKSAYYIIRDCARITIKYIPLFLYGKMKNPIAELKGAFTDKEIRDFVKQADDSMSSKQLLNLILVDINVKIPTADKSSVVKFDDDAEYDPYSEYGMDEPPTPSAPAQDDYNKWKDASNILIEAFKK